MFSPARIAEIRI